MKIKELSESHADLESRAKIFAIRAHRQQKYGKHPYTVHLADVVERVKNITDNPEIIAAAWLHDVVEDTAISINDISNIFGENVARIVWAVTGEGANRKARMASAIAKIAQTPGAELVKSADRLSNVSASKRDGRHDLWSMYKGEHPNLSPVLGDNELAKELIRLFAD